jgi:hypothetical protein
VKAVGKGEVIWGRAICRRLGRRIQGGDRDGVSVLVSPGQGSGG